ncbi:MAG TPA: hypothetical protein P5555_05105 [Candidatus Paceibacterota bacterium]|nr:hypothetical protein [Verrucomicrobiota bacterium]HRZ44550.1 hypothetical protein [Candidatus Paceibacterota bacterium]HRZ92420.1 hypothetical protein [Candidatus Paceibacterota bacterium]
MQPHVVRISTPSGSGTGFLISNGRNNDIAGVATAAHVVRSRCVAAAGKTGRRKKGMNGLQG